MPRNIYHHISPSQVLPCDQPRTEATQNKTFPARVVLLKKKGFWVDFVKVDINTSWVTGSIHDAIL